MSRQTLSVASLATFFLLLFLPAVHGFAPAPPPHTYSWIAEFVASDSASKTITVKARIPEYVSKYTDRFKPGDRVMLVWNMLPAVPVASAAPPAGAAKDPAGTVAGGDKAASPSPAPIALKTESDRLMFIDAYEAMKSSKIEDGYILPAEFVAADAKAVTVTLHVPDGILQAVASMPPGTLLRATSPMHQPSEQASISAAAGAGNPEAPATPKK